MVSALDVAAYILSRMGAMTAMKLQKLVYYCQAWSLVWEEEPLFSERIEAWANGPVVPELYERHKGSFSVSSIDGGNLSKLQQSEINVIDSVITFYGHYTAQQLSDLTHAEKPWNEARGSCPPGHRSNAEITPASLHEYYSSIF